MIVKYANNPQFANTYFIGLEGKECFLVDPGDNSNGKIDKYIDRHYSSLKGILLTHGHYDHIYGLTNLAHKAPIYIGYNDIRCLTDSKYNLCPGLEIEGYEVISLYENDILSLDELSIKVIETPFHTEGSLCFYIEKLRSLISGDTLFHLSYGRYDLPGGDKNKIRSSLSKLARLPKETIIYPGHESNTILENELKYNPGFKL